MQLNLFVVSIASIGALVNLSGSAAVAQQWNVSNPPVTVPVPQYHPTQQYRPVYPLDDGADQNATPPDLVPAPSVPSMSNDAPAPQQSTQQLPPEFIDAPAQIIRAIPKPETSVAPFAERVNSGDPRLGFSDAPDNSKSLGLDYSIYRDRHPFPADPRKPCNVCTHPPSVPNRFNLPGLHGLPYQPKEPGGCRCGKKHAPKFAAASVYWSRPFSALGHHESSSDCLTPYGPMPEKRLTDLLDPLASFKLIPYQRTDNGYCGRGADPFGCLGESRYR